MARIYDCHLTQTQRPPSRASEGVKLVALRDRRTGRRYELSSNNRQFVLGTAEGCDIVITDPYASAKHCSIERLDAKSSWFLRDHSKNGTCINGTRVRVAELKAGGRLSIGDTCLDILTEETGTQEARLRLVGDARNFVAQIQDLGPTVAEGFDQLLLWLEEGPIGYDRQQLDQLFDSAMEALSGAAGSIASQLGTIAVAVVEGFTALALALVLLFFFVKDGEQLVAWFLKMTPTAHRDDVRAAGQRGWVALSGFVRGTSLVALIDAVGIGLGLLILGVPLVLPLSVLVFFGRLSALGGHRCSPVRGRCPVDVRSVPWPDATPADSRWWGAEAPRRVRVAPMRGRRGVQQSDRPGAPWRSWARSALGVQ